MMRGEREVALKGSNYNGITEKKRGLKWKVKAVCCFAFWTLLLLLIYCRFFLWLAKMGLGGWEFKPDIWDLDDISSEKISKKEKLFWISVFTLRNYHFGSVYFSLAGINPPLGVKNIFMCRKKSVLSLRVFFRNVKWVKQALLLRC